jgi:hypothetical protein
MPVRLISVAILLAASALTLTAQKTPALDKALQSFWAADTADRREAAIGGVLSSGVSYDDLAARLKAGREYRAAKTGRVKLPTSDRASRSTTSSRFHPSTARPARGRCGCPFTAALGGQRQARTIRRRAR